MPRSAYRVLTGMCRYSLYCFIIAAWASQYPAVLVALGLAWLVDVAGVFPVRHLETALLTAYNPHTTGAGFAGTDLLIVALWGAGGLAFARWRFSWVPLSR